jgi:predicted  nucleic acid-binding Zn-ribbon protein
MKSKLQKIQIENEDLYNKLSRLQFDVADLESANRKSRKQSDDEHIKMEQAFDMLESERKQVSHLRDVLREREKEKKELDEVCYFTTCVDNR